MEGIKRACRHEWSFTAIDLYYVCLKCGDVGVPKRRGRHRGEVHRLSKTVQDVVKERIQKRSAAKEQQS